MKVAFTQDWITIAVILNLLNPPASATLQAARRRRWGLILSELAPGALTSERLIGQSPDSICVFSSRGLLQE